MSDLQIDIRVASATDAKGIAGIYNYYIRESVITFEESDVSVDEMSDRITKIAALSLPWLVAEQDNAIVGYAYATKWRERSAYRFAVESSVYLDHSVTGKGTGKQLYRELLSRLRDKKIIRTVIGGIALPNDASIALHERLGFTKVAHFNEVGFKFERWVDVAYWQLQL
jgi:phosphinothricin acetyltransferase